MKVQVRKALKEDCSRMLELIKELALYERAPEEVTVDFNHFVESGFGKQPVWWAYVAEVEDENGSKMIAGFALYYIRYSTWKGQKLYLEDIVVTAEMRGKGIGRLLFEKLIEVVKENDYQGMSWQVLDWNEPALNFYRKFEGVSFDESWMNGNL